MKTLQYLFQETQINFLINGTDRNVMINATEMAKAFDKETREFMRNNSTKNFIKALENTSEQCGITHRSDFKITDNRGHLGLFFCEELALKFAAWLSPEFEVWVYQQIKEITFGNYAKHWDAHTISETLKLEISKLRVDFKNNGASKEEIALYFEKETALATAKNAKTAAIRNQLNLFKGLDND